MVAGMNFRAVSSLALALSVVFVARSVMAATCTLGEHDGIDDVEAKVASGIVCHELSTRSNGSFEVQLGKLNGRTLVTLVNRQDGSRVRTFVSGLDEVDVAAPRLASSLVEAKPLVDTRNVDNVLAEETRPAKKVATETGATMGTFVMSSFGTNAAPSAGIDVGLTFRTGHFGLSGDGRLGGIGSGATKMGTASIDVGGRLYLTNNEWSPFIGAGVELSYFKRNAEKDADERSGSGAGAFVTVGAELLRSSHVGLMAGLRLDLPFYELEQARPDMNPAYAALGYAPAPSPPGRAIYAAPISLTVALAFH